MIYENRFFGIDNGNGNNNGNTNGSNKGNGNGGGNGHGNDNGNGIGNSNGIVTVSVTVTVAIWYLNVKILAQNTWWVWRENKNASQEKKNLVRKMKQTKQKES